MQVIIDEKKKEVGEMALIQWSEKLSVQVATMDQHHKKLIDMINELNEAMSKGKGKEVIGKIIGGLLSYTRMHFGEEEKMMERANYPDLSEQKNMHRLFINKVEGFKQDYEKGSIGLSIKVIDFLSDWLKNHILIEDKKYGPHVNQQGIK